MVKGGKIMKAVLTKGKVIALFHEDEDGLELEVLLEKYKNNPDFQVREATICPHCGGCGKVVKGDEARSNNGRERIAWFD
jgi:hypothetical protein